VRPSDVNRQDFHSRCSSGQCSLSMCFNAATPTGSIAAGADH
jgi:hypothetical protein